MQKILMIASVLSVGVLARNPDHWRDQTFLGLTVALAFACLHVSRLVHWSAGLALGISAYSGLVTGMHRFSPYSGRGFAWVTTIDAIAVSSLVFLLLTTIPLLFARARHIRGLLVGFQWLGLIDSLWVIWNHLSGHPALGVMDNPAIDATLIAMVYPSMLCAPASRFIWVDALFVMLPPIAILTTGSSTGIGLLGLIAAAFAFSLIRNSQLRAFAVFACAVTALIVGVMIVGSLEFFSPNGRFEVWEMSMRYWADHVSWLKGSGLGTFLLEGPPLQRAVGWPKESIFIWMHNDWLQVLFELGVIGLLATLALYLSALWCSQRRAWLMISLLVYGAGAMTQMPLRHFLMAFYGALLIRISFDRGLRAVS